MGNCFNELKAINTEMIGGHSVRIKNYEEGIDTRKQLNAIVQRASRLRGKQKVY